MDLTSAAGRAHPQLLRGPHHAWWRCLVSLLAFGLLHLMAMLVLVLFEVVAFGGFGGYLGDLAGATTTAYGGMVFLVYVAIALASVRVGFGVGPGWVVSVAGRVRSGWLTVVVPVALGVAVVAAVWRVLVASPAPFEIRPDAGDGLGWAAVAALVAVCVALVEEVALRGWLAQSVGSLLASPTAAVALAGLVSTCAFVWWRRPEGLVETAAVSVLGLLLFALVTLTGGLEASVGVNAGLHLALLVPYAHRYGLDAAAPAPSLGLVPVLVAAAAAVVLVLVSRRRRLVIHGRPEGPARELSDLRNVRGVR